MEHCLYEFKLLISEIDVDDFIEILSRNGYLTQADAIEKQHYEQLNKLN